MPPRHLADLAGTRRSQFRINPAGAAGAPTTGAHLIGELHIDSVGSVWYCTTAGTPGTWVAGNVVIAGQSSPATGPQVIDTVAIASFRTVRWAVELRKALRYRVLEIVASHDGVTPQHQIPTSFEFGTGANDITVDVDISGGNLRLLTTPATTGWILTWSRLYALRA